MSTLTGQNGKKDSQRIRVTTLADEDLIGFVKANGPNGGFTSKVISVEDFVESLAARIERASYKVERFATSGTISNDTDIVLSTGTHTLVMPTALDNGSPITVKSVSGTITLNIGTNTIENSNLVSGTVARTLYLDGTTWRDI